MKRPAPSVKPALETLQYKAGSGTRLQKTQEWLMLPSPYPGCSTCQRAREYTAVNTAVNFPVEVAADNTARWVGNPLAAVDTSGAERAFPARSARDLRAVSASDRPPHMAFAAAVFLEARSWWKAAHIAVVVQDTLARRAYSEASARSVVKHGVQQAYC